MKDEGNNKIGFKTIVIFLINIAHILYLFHESQKGGSDVFGVFAIFTLIFLLLFNLYAVFACLVLNALLERTSLKWKEQLLFLLLMAAPFLILDLLFR